MIPPFRAFVVDQTADGFTMGIQQMERHDLPPGDVLIQMAYAAMNYKDALVHGGYSEYARVPGDFLFRLPAGSASSTASCLQRG